jgi:phage tail-like protein
VASPKTQRAKCFTSHFKCDLSNHILSISPITARFPPVPASDGRHWQYKVTQPGQPCYGNITFEGAEHKDSIGNIKNWVKEVYDGKEIRKDISIEVYDQAKDTVRTFNLMDTFPTHFSILDCGADGQSGTVIRWTLEVRVNRIQMA